MGRVEIGSKSGGILRVVNTLVVIDSRAAYFKGIDQTLLRDGVKAFGTSAVIPKPYVMTIDGLHRLKERRKQMITHNLDRVAPSHCMNTSR